MAVLTPTSQDNGGSVRHVIAGATGADKSAPIDCRGFTHAWFAVGAVTTPVDATTELLVASVDLASGKENLLVEGAAPVVFKQANIIAAGNASEAGWLTHLPDQISIQHGNGAGVFDIVVELHRAPLACG